MFLCAVKYEAEFAYIVIKMSIHFTDICPILINFISIYEKLAYQDLRDSENEFLAIKAREPLLNSISFNLSSRIQWRDDIRLARQDIAVAKCIYNEFKNIMFQLILIHKD